MGVKIMPDTKYTEFFFNIEAKYITKEEFDKESNTYILSVQLPAKEHSCPECSTPVTQTKDYRVRKVLLGYQESTKVIAHYRQRRYRCPNCGKAFSEYNPFVGHYQHISKHCKYNLMEAFGQATNFKSIAQTYHLSITTVIRYFSAIKIGLPKKLPKVLSIDEFKGNAGHHKYQVALNDPESKTTIDILPTRDTMSLILYFAQFSRAARKAVKFVVMDMSNQFRYVIKLLFPHATIVGDRFHISRVVMWAMERVRKQEQKNLSALSRMFKSNKRLLRKNRDKLKEHEKIKLAEILRKSPNIRKAYILKCAFLRLKRAIGKENIQKGLHKWLQLVKASGLKEFQPILNSFKSWEEIIIQGFLLPYSNGFTEGVNNKIKVLKRISYGLPNFDRLRVRILILNTKKNDEKSSHRSIMAKRCSPQHLT